MFQRTPQCCSVLALLALLAACSGSPDEETKNADTGSGGNATSSGGTSGNDETDTGGASSSGGTNIGGSPSGSGGNGPATPSMGCGSTSPPASGTYTIDVDGMEREYILTLPDDYDSSKPYPVIFAWHPLGGSAEQVANPTGWGLNAYYGLLNRANGSVIFVAGNGLPDEEGRRGWPNTNNRDIRFLEEMLDRFRSELCIDESRLLSTGFSYGGMMTMTISCRMGQIFRAVAPMAGSLWGGYNTCVDEPLAALIIHGVNDGVNSFGVPVQGSRDFRDYLLETNNCSDSSMPVDPSPCRAYSGCDDGYPVTYCEFEGEHEIPPFASEAIWDFFSQFL